MKLMACLLLLSLALCWPLHSIIVKQEKDGRIVISDSQPNPLQRRLSQIRTSSPSPRKPPATDGISPLFLEKIRRICAKLNFRVDLAIAVARVESSFNPYAISHKGAMGIMQLMTDTARSYGVKNPFNIDQNLEGGIRHLQYLYKKYNEDLPLTLAAYNAGEEAVARYGGIPPYRETRRYIQKSMGCLGIPYSSSSMKLKTRIYRYVTAEGKIVISDQRPMQPKGKIEIFD